MNLEKSSVEDVQSEKICGNCFWFKFCSFRIEGLSEDSACVFRPAVFLESPDGLLADTDAQVGRIVRGFHQMVDAGEVENKFVLAEKYLLIDALIRNNWSQLMAARDLGVTPRTINYMTFKYGINHPSWRRNYGKGEQ
jgi:hypothetical protein